MIRDRKLVKFPSKPEKQVMKSISEVNWYSWWVCVSMLPFIPYQNLHIFIISVRSRLYRHILWKVSAGKPYMLSFLIPSPLFQGIMNSRPIFLISSYISEEGMKEILGDLQSCVFVHSWLSVSWGDDSRYKVMENQDQVSRRCVDDGAISPHLWDHTIWFQVDIWQAMEFITIWLANLRVKFLVFPKQYDLTLLDRKMKKNMQKISTIVHIWLKIKNERGSEKFECFKSASVWLSDQMVEFKIKATWVS